MRAMLTSTEIWSRSVQAHHLIKGLGSWRGEIGPAIEMHTDLKYVYMVYFTEKNRNFICLVLKLWKLWVSKDKDPLLILHKK